MNPMKTCCVSVEVSVGNLVGLNLLNIQMERRVLVGKHHFCEALRATIIFNHRLPGAMFC